MSGKMDDIYEMEMSSNLFSDPILLSIIIGGALFLLFLLGLLWKKARPVPRNTVLFVGLSDSGKTLVLSRFATGERIETYTSMQENRCAGAVADTHRCFQLVDVPGAERVRKNRLVYWLQGEGRKCVAGIVLLVDSFAYGKQARDVAELLYELLVHFPKSAKLLIACNKQDVPLAKSAMVVRSSLEKELTLLAKTRAASLHSTAGDEKGGDELVLDENGHFKWEYVNKPQVTFVECRALDAQSDDDDKYDLEPVKDWIETLSS